MAVALCVLVHEQFEFFLPVGSLWSPRFKLAILRMLMDR